MRKSSFSTHKKSVLIGILFILQAPVYASNSIDSVAFNFATGNKTQMARVGLQSNWGNQWFASNGTHIGGFWELSLAEWRGNQYQNSAGEPQYMTDIGFTPVFRFQRDDKFGFYSEAGVGAHYLTGLYDNNGRRLSTHLEFGSQLGIGYVFSNKMDVGLKVQHFSNGGIEHPNNGVNFVVAHVAYRF